MRAAVIAVLVLHAAPAAAVIVTACGQGVQSIGRLEADLDCTTAPGPAVRLAADASLDLAGFTIHGHPSSDGVYCAGSCTVRGPGTIRDAQYGIYSGGQVRLVGVTVRENDSVGVFAERGVAVRDSTITQNRGEGILNYEGLASVVRSEVSFNGALGVTSDYRVRVSDSVIVGNEDTGIDSFDGSIRVYRSEVRDNGYDGIAASERAVVIDSQITGNDVSGVMGLEVRVRRSVIARNSYEGVYAEEKAVVRESVIEANLAAGVNCDKRVRVTGSTIRANLGGGVFAASASLVDSTVVDNACAYRPVGCGDLATAERPAVTRSRCDRSVNTGAIPIVAAVAPSPYRLVTFRLLPPVTVTELRIRVDYAAADGDVVESPWEAFCTVSDEWSGAVVVDAAANTLMATTYDFAGITGPANIADCVFDAGSAFDPAAMAITVTYANGPANVPIVPLPTIDVLVDEFIPAPSLATWGVCADDTP